MDRKEAIEIVRMCCPKIANSECDFETAMRVLVPELKESEDERVRKEIISYIKSSGAVTNSNWIAWLEKQGENVYNEELSKSLHEVICYFINNPNIPYLKREIVSKKIIPYVEKIEKQGSQNLANSAKTCKVEPKVIIPKFRVGDIIRLKVSDAEYKITEISDGYYRGKGWFLDIVAADESDEYELVKQKPAWSEEDEDYLIDVKTAFYGYFDEGYAEELCNWLKSLKERYTWKPNEEQMEAIKQAAEQNRASEMGNILDNLLVEIKNM